MADIANHQRVNDILLGPLERPTLNWLARHAPAWITPDICTIIGILGALVTMFSYIASRYDSLFLWLASVGFVINWYGDSLDGTLARLRRIERPIFGFFIDHTVDAFITIMIFTGLGATLHVSFNVASMALVGYLLMSVLVYVQTSAVGEFKISYGKLGPTEIRVLAILLNTAMFFGGVITFPVNLEVLGQYSLNPYDLAVGAIAAILFFFATSTAIRQAVRLKDVDKGGLSSM